MAHKKLRVTLVKSKYHTGRKHMATVKGLGLRRRHHTVELDDTPAVRGMINKISYMVKCEEV
jgi:large subunit ribosomal protein L30